MNTRDALTLSARLPQDAIDECAMVEESIYLLTVHAKALREAHGRNIKPVFSRSAIISRCKRLIEAMEEKS